VETGVEKRLKGGQHEASLAVGLPDSRLPEADACRLAQLRGGDVEAGHRFVRDYYPGIYRYLLSLTGHREAAEDLTQETFLQAWRHLDQFQGRGSLRLWLHAIARREFLRARGRPRRGMPLVPGSASEQRVTSLEEVAVLPEPHAGAWTDEVELRVLLGKLPEEQREVLLLHSLAGYSSREIAEIVQVPASTVRYRLGLARASLVQALGPGDLAYLNEPSIPMRQWTWLPLDQIYALETRLGGVRCSVFGARPSEPSIPNTRSEATKEDEMERREFLRQAAVGAAGLVLSETEKEVIDSRLTQKVICAFKGTALSDLCEKLKSDTGIHLVAGPSVADEKVTLFCEKLPLREVMRQLSRPFGYTWLRSGTPGQYRYELVQDLRSQLLEEELRSRDRHAALLALEQELEKYRPYLQLTPDEMLARSKTAPPAEKKLLETLSGLGYGPIQMYFRLSPQEMAATRAGQWLSFSADSRPDAPPPPRLPANVGPQPALRPLPSDVARGILQSWRHERIARTPIGLSPVGAEDLEGVPIESVPEVSAWLVMALELSELGQYQLTGNSGFQSPDGLLRGDIQTISGGRSPKVLQPDNETVNAQFAADPALRSSISVLPQSAGCAAPALGASPESSSPPKVTTADVLEALHRATGIPIVTDFYTRLYKPETVTVRNQSTFAALNRLADAMRLRWNKQHGTGGAGTWLQFRSTSFYDDRLKEVPNRLLSRWGEAWRRQGFLTLEELVEIAQLPDAALKGEEMAEGARLCYGLAEWDLARNEWVLDNLRFLAQLTPSQRQEAQTTAGLPMTRMTIAQQQAFLDRAIGSRAIGLNEGEGLQSLEDLAGATLRVDYSQPGWYEWAAPGGISSLRWVVPLGPPPDGRLLLVPVVRERTRQAALEALRRVDPRIREAVWEAVRRSDPRSQPPAEEEQIVPSKLDLFTLYIPGSRTRFPVQFQATDRQSNAGGW
jgi:RNA polymerase sigma-70 factor (ECF subfamily)